MDEPTNGLWHIPSKSQAEKSLALTINEEKCLSYPPYQIRDLHSLINHVIILDQTKVLFNQSLSKISEHPWFGNVEGHQWFFIYSDASFIGKEIHLRTIKWNRSSETSISTAHYKKTEKINNAPKKLIVRQILCIYRIRDFILIWHLPPVKVLDNQLSVASAFYLLPPNLWRL
jgi:ABC-2 type transport system ATP-binding protein